MIYWARFTCLILGLAITPSFVISNELMEYNPDLGIELNDSVQQQFLVMSEAIKRNEVRMNEMTEMIALRDTKIEAMQDNINILEEKIAFVEKSGYSSTLSSMFLVESDHGGWWLPKGDIHFETVKTDISGSFDKESGTFTAPSDGTYIFFFNCPIGGGSDVKMYVYVNDILRQLFENQYNGTKDNRVLSVFWSLDLNVNDKLKLSNYYESTLFDGYNQGMFFMGYKI